MQTKVLGFESYEVYPDGKVWSSLRSKFLKPYITENGYQQVALYRDKKPYFFKVHRLVATTFLPNIVSLPQINHKNGIKTDNRVGNLEWCNASTNLNHAYINGLAHGRKGTKHHGAKITESDAKAIRNLRVKGLSLKQIGQKFGITDKAVSLIALGKRWSHV